MILRRLFARKACSRLVAALAGTLGLGLSAAAQPTAAILSPADTARYAAAFAAAAGGDAPGAETALTGLADPSLIASVRAVEYLNAPTPPAYEALSAWLAANASLPDAARIYSLALKIKPAGARLTAPALPLIALPPAPVPVSRRSLAARQAYFSGDVAQAGPLAEADGDRWIAGLAAWRQGRFADATEEFAALARDTSAGDEARAGADFWAARAAKAGGLDRDAREWLRAAASAPNTFYGLIARRRLDLADDPLGRLIQSAGPTPTPISAGALDVPAVRRLLADDPRAHRAVALAQLGRALDAGLELRVGLAMADTAEARAAWTSLALDLNGDAAPPAAAPSTDGFVPSFIYPTPKLEPIGGFVLNKALVYALAWRESRFNSLAVSPRRAVGLMQVMPLSAAAATGDPSFRDDPIPLFDPATNLEAGQAYLRWLRDSAVGSDLPRLIAAYNGGPGCVQKAVATSGAEDDLAIIESLPAAETRDYVHKVLLAYWSYRRQFGRPSPSLDALASGARTVDIDLDR